MFLKILRAAKRKILFRRSSKLPPAKPTPETPPINYRVLKFDYYDYEAILVIVYQDMNFMISVKVKAPGGPDGEPCELSAQFPRLVSAYRTQSDRRVHDWMVEPCWQQIIKVAPGFPGWVFKNLEEFYNRPTYHLTLNCVDNRFQVSGRVPDTWVVPWIRPHVHRNASALLALAMKEKIPLVKASRLEILWRPDEGEQDSYRPRFVRMDDGSMCYFKAATGDGRFAQELSTLLALRQKAPVGLRVSKLAGIVEWEDGDGYAGLLLEAIPHKGTLYEVLRETTPSQRNDMAEEIKQTVKELHEVGLVWGDVRLENILIDHQNHAWVINFGGGSTGDGADMELRHSKLGDDQGIARVLACLIENRQS